MHSHPFRLTAVALAAALVLSGCSLLSGGKQNQNGVDPIPVSVTEAKTGRVTAASPASAQIEPVLTVPVTAKIPGRVTVVHKEMGDRVKAGDVLAELEDRDASAQLAQANAAVAQAEAQRAEAERQAARLAELLKAGAVSQQQAEQVQTQATLAAAQVQSARASLELARANFDRTRITASADGVLASRNVEPGAMVGAGTTLFYLVDLSTVVVKAAVAERDVNQIAPGTSVPVKVPALEREFSGKVEAVSPAMDRQTRSYQVKVTMANPDGVLKGGMFAEVRFPVREHEGIVLPVSAVVERNGDQVLFVVENGVARQVMVKVVLSANDTVVVEGIKAGQQVVTAGQNRLFDGAPVKVEGSAGL